VLPVMDRISESKLHITSQLPGRGPRTVMAVVNAAIHRPVPVPTTTGRRYGHSEPHFPSRRS
jgi:hypothetical protein